MAGSLASSTHGRALCRTALAVGILTGPWVSPVWGADPQAYDIKVGQTDAADLNDALAASSLLVGLRAKAPAGPYALVARARDDVGRMEQALQSFGYYRGKITIEIDHHPLSDLSLADRLEAVPTGTAVLVNIAVTCGPLYRLRHISLDGEIPPGTAHPLGITSGQPAVAGAVLDAGAKLLTALEEQGYALAKVDSPVATQDDAARAIDVSFRVAVGPKVEIGAIAFKGLRDVHEAFARRSLTIHSGQLYQPSKIEAARRSLLALGVFSGVAVHAADRLDPAGRMPLTFEMQERSKHTVAFSGAYSTDLGLSLSASWSDRNLLGNADQLNLSAAGTELGGTATTGLGYNVIAQFIEPEFMARQNDLELDLSGIKQQFVAYDQTAETLGGFLRRKLSMEWKGGIGLSVTEENIAQEGVTRSYQLLAAPVNATLDSTGLTDFLQDPTQGVRANLTVTPTRSFGRSASTFTILSASASTYFDLSDNGVTVIALRALAGSAVGASQFDLPPDERLYAGGSGTIRGYKYQSVGPLFPDGNPIGGTSLDAATVELRQRLVGNWGAAFFADAGQASAEAEPLTGSLRIGAGAGVRYCTPIGPVRLDIAAPMTPVPHGDAFELYIGLGQAF